MPWIEQRRVGAGLRNQNRLQGILAAAVLITSMQATAGISSPDSGSSDAILFAEVVNSSDGVVASFAGDTGYSINTILSGNFGYSGFLFGNDDNFRNLWSAAYASGDYLVWALQGGQYTGNLNFSLGTPGKAQFITTTSYSSADQLRDTNTRDLVQWAAGLNYDIYSLNANFTNLSTTVEGPNPATAGIWDATVPDNISTWYGEGPYTENDYFSGAETLFSVTGNGVGEGVPVRYSAVGTAFLSDEGLFLQGADPVPLPAATWLLLSGLTGLGFMTRARASI